MGDSQLMYLVDLPADLSPGRVALKPENAFCHRLTRCAGCQCHSSKGIQCACGHTFCSRCAIASTTNATEDVIVWCSVCQKKEEADPLPENKVLDKMRFSCRCGVEGSLREIKKHFWVEPERGGHRRVSVDDDDTSNAAALTCQRGQTVCSEQENSVNALGERLEAFGEQLRELRESTKTISSGIVGLEASAGHHGQGVFWVNVRKLIEEYRREKSNVHSALYKWYANGNTIGTQFMVLEKEDEPWFGVVHRAAFGITNEPYKPFRMLIGVKVLDIYGVVVETGVAATYEGSKPTKAFEKPLPDHVSGGVGPYLISIAALMRPEAKIVTPSGLVNVQFECLPPLI